MADEITQHDERKRRCPMLGHQIAFAYCRAPGSDTPCRRVLDCWFEAFDVEAFLLRHYGEETVQRLRVPAEPKAVRLVELIRQAQERMKPPEDEEKA